MRVFELVQNKSWFGVIVALLILCCANFASAQDSGAWQHELTIYGWYAGIDGTAKIPGAPGSGTYLTVEASDILENLEMIFMGGWQSKYNRWSIITDVVYMDVGDSSTQTVIGAQGVPVNASVDLDISSWVLHGGVGYDVVQSDRGTLAVVGGVRYLTLDVDVKIGLLGPGMEQSGSEGILDGIVGVRGNVKLGENWYLPYYADIGTGDSELTWQLFAGVGYRFSWGDVRLGYRHLSYDLEDDMAMQDMQLSGPILGVGFQF